MHIALITRLFVPGYGGLEGVQGHLAHHLTDLGCRVTVFAEKWIRPVPVNIRVIPVHPSKNKLLHKSVCFTKALQRQIPSADFDCTLANTPYFPCDIHRAGGGINRFWYDLKPAVYGPAYRLINHLPKYASALALEQQVYQPDNIQFQIANSRLVKQQMVDVYGYPEDRISVVYNGIDFNTFDWQWRIENRDRLRNEMSISTHKLVVLFVSNNHKRKGLHSLIKAVRTARMADKVEILVVGRGKKLSTSVTIRYVGHTDRMRRYYAVADALVLPTYYEPCANVVLEAMACGMPVMTTPFNGASEFIEHGKSGLILAHGNDFHGIQEGLLDWIEHPDAAREMGRKGLASVSGLTWGNCARQVYRLCKQVTSRYSSL